MPSMANQILDNLTFLRNKFERAYGAVLEPTESSDLPANLPEDYAVFLCQIGGGTIGDSFYSIYDKPLNSSYIYGSDAPAHLKKLLFIGDDFSGFCVALDPDRQWAVVEVDKYSQETEVLAKTLYDFLMNDWRFNPSAEEA